MELYIEDFRLGQGMSLRELSRLSGVSVSHIHNIEQGHKSPTIKTLCKLSYALKVPCKDLFSCGWKGGNPK